MKLNGWRKLWILLSIIYFVLVISYVIVDFPTAEKIPHASEFYKNLSKRSAEIIIPANHADAVILGDESVVPLDLLPQQLIWEVKMKKLEMPNGHTIAFSAKSSEEDMRIASQEYWKAVEQKASEKRRHLLLYAFLFWLVPCMGLYALGWGINWAHIGMRPSMMKPIDKFKAKQFGVLFIIVGAFIPSILYPFTSLTTTATLTKVAFAMKGASYDTSLQDLEIVIMKGEWKKESKSGGGHYGGRLAIPYRYTIAFGILLVFIGIGIVALYKNKKETD